MAFVNTEYFREPAIHFQKYGRYADGDYGTYEWYEYWQREHDRVINGYEVGGCKITGMHYLYLNYLPIKRLTSTEQGDYSIHKNRRRKASRGEDFPSFWDEDVVVFHTWDIARNGISIEDLDRLEQFAGSIPLVRTEENLRGGKNHLWLKPRGVGAPQPLNEIVITPDGETTIGELKVGDYVMTPKGTKTRVGEIHEKGNLKAYELTLSDGRKVKCGLDHTWRVHEYTGREYDYTTAEILKKGLYVSSGQTRFYLPDVKPVEFTEKELPVDPFLMGVVMSLYKGFGDSVNFYLEFTSEEERYYALNVLYREYGRKESMIRDLENVVPRKNVTRYRINFKRGNPLYNDLRKCNYLKDTSGAFLKLPEIYRYTSIKQKEQLLKGLTVNKIKITGKNLEMYFNSKLLADDTLYILRSLGYYPHFRESNIYKGAKWMIRVIIKEPFFISSNKNIRFLRNDTVNPRVNRVGIVDIKEMNLVTPMRCIGVEDEDHLYLTRDFIATHNSWKGAVIPVHRQFFGERNSTFLVADSNEYLIKDGLWSKYISYRNSLNTYGDGRNTELVHGFSRNFIHTNTKDKMYTAGVKEYDNQNKLIEAGRLTTVYGIILEGNPDKIRGKRGTIVWEEFGSFPTVARAWQIARESIEEDGNVFDTMYGFGTGGDEGANIEDLTVMHSDPKTYNILEFHNEWDVKFTDQICAYFTPAYKSLSFNDKDGNSDIIAGKEFFDARRAEYELSADAQELPRHKAEKPYTPAEALSQSYSNIFPTEDLKLHLLQIQVNKAFNTHVTNGVLKDNGLKGVEFIPDPSLIRYDDYPVTRGVDKTGAVCIMHKPYLHDGYVPKNMYRICVDPYRHDDTTGESIGAIYVIENPNRLTYYKGDKIVAWFTARPKKQDEFNKNLFLLAKLYDCKIAPENDEPGDIVGYAKRYKLTSYLEDEFELAYDTKIASTRKTGRPGMHIASGKNNLRKLQGDKYIQEWLLRIRGYDSDGDPIRNLHTILDVGLLKELISYKDGRNADRISALRVGMYYEKEFAYKNKKIQTESRNFNPFFGKTLFAS